MVYIKATNSKELSFTDTRSVSVTTPEPKLNCTFNPDDDTDPQEIEWSYIFAGKGNTSYNLTTYYFFELGDGSAHGVNPFTFDITIDFQMVNEIGPFGLSRVSTNTKKYSFSKSKRT